MEKVEFNKCDSFVGLHIVVQRRIQEKKLYMICVYIDTVGGGCVISIALSFDEISFPNNRVKKPERNRKKMKNKN